MCKSTSCCCPSSSPASPGAALILPAALIAGWALASAIAAILADLIDALAVATACAVAGTAVFCAWRVRVLTRPAPDARRGQPLSTPAGRLAIGAPASRAIEPPRPPAAEAAAVYGTPSEHPGAGKAAR